MIERKRPMGLGAYLDNYKKKQNGPQCWLCGIPERGEVDEERRKRGSGCGVKAVVEYLQAIHGDKATRSRVGNHFRERHHER